MFNYKRQFKRYGKSFVAVVNGTEGYYDKETGEYVPPQEPKEENMMGIIAQVGDDDLKNDEGGLLTVEDKKILIDTDHYSLHRDQKVVVQGEIYQVRKIAPYSLYSHFMKVYIKRESV
ncbi:hypothetical protein G4V62_13815 [Bacillaceae bacterium SIJ1]|uniref:hypothetical protein n=1 Tax=Litoribacterium kuwaitense TaxID=1398745 RepID=UPI0013E9B921|nr:hypothetical protein [Litoribacterium kuwaitense]NGP45971.1 hypothetical protein [Litoribacterium kuwaitense]